jgi:hypothetical protein
LQQASQAIGQQMYAQQQAAAGGPQARPGAGPSPGGDGREEGEDVVEGEFREV